MRNLDRRIEKLEGRFGVSNLLPILEIRIHSVNSDGVVTATRVISIDPNLSPAEARD